MEGVVSNSSQLDLSMLHPCTHEEVDTCIFVHVSDISRNGAKRVTITSTDTDVIVIALYAFRYLNLDELWVNFGHGQHQRWYPIHTHALILGKERCDALPFWYALTGCDTVSQFAGRAKKTAWNTWSAFPEATQSFARLSTLNVFSDEDINIVQRFVVLMYDRAGELNDVNKCGQHLFTKKNRQVEGCPPT